MRSENIKMALNFEDSNHKVITALESLKDYSDLCEAQLRSIESYAQVVNKLKDDIDSIVKVKVRDDERAKCAADYLQDCCDAIEAARLEEREKVLAEMQLKRSGLMGLGNQGGEK